MPRGLSTKEAVAAAVEKVLSATMDAKRTINQSQSTKLSQVVAAIQPIIIKPGTVGVTNAFSTSTKLIMDEIKRTVKMLADGKRSCVQHQA